MREKLLALMKSEGLKSSQLAEMLGINPAGISHILAGRNKPGFDLLQKMLRRFPRLNPDWLLLDQGEMYRDEEVKSDGGALMPEAPRSGLRQNDLFAQTAARAENSSSDPIADSRPASRSASDPLGSIPVINSSNSSASVERVIIFYSDRTCESYTLTNRVKE